MRKHRNRLLEEMTGEVGELVLRNNYLQSQALSCAVAQAPSLLEVHERLIESLEREGRLDRALEFLPDKERIAERRAAGGGLTAPELSVLLAYVKIKLFQELVDSALPDDAFFAAAACLPAAAASLFGATSVRDTQIRRTAASVRRSAWQGWTRLQPSRCLAPRQSGAPGCCQVVREVSEGSRRPSAVSGAPLSLAKSATCVRCLAGRR